MRRLITTHVSPSGHVVGEGAVDGTIFEQDRCVPSEEEDLDEELDRTRQAVLDALAAAAHGEVPARGPRGGVIWTPRYFVRRVAWHVLDHAWEIEDRVV